MSIAVEVARSAAGIVSSIGGRGWFSAPFKRYTGSPLLESALILFISLSFLSLHHSILTLLPPILWPVRIRTNQISVLCRVRIRNESHAHGVLIARGQCRCSLIQDLDGKRW